MLPLSDFFEQAEDVFSLSTFILFERLVISVQLFWEGSNVVLDFFHNYRTNIKLNINLTIFLIFGTQIGYLQFDLTEFCDYIMKAIA